jgi:pyruvate formate-lyase/glycerol dehydratase family glycyl radical enzyme
MAIESRDKNAESIGSWQELYVPATSDRVKKLRENALRIPEICLERARVEMNVYEQYKHEPRIIQRARFLETYLKEKSIFIGDDELIVGNINSKVRGSIFDGTMSSWMEKELDDPVKDPQNRPFDKHIIHPEERKELREVLIPYFKGKTLVDYNLTRIGDDVKEKAYPSLASCPHIPNIADRSMARDAGHQMANYEKVLHKGLKGIREEVLWQIKQTEQPYAHYSLQEKQDFYRAVLISIDAAIAYSKRYADLAREKAAKENNPKRKQELERIAEVCAKVPANPARNWWEAVQSVWMLHVIISCELSALVHCFGRFDQYMYPFYKKSVIDEKSMTSDEALELLECFWIKTNGSVLRSYALVKVLTGMGLGNVLTMGGQTREGEDACNDVTMLCLEADEQVGVLLPETAFRIWEGTLDKYLRKAVELARLGRGKPKFICDKKGIRMLAKSYPELSVEDWREYALLGCTETDLPSITMGAIFEGVNVIAKIMELVVNNGKCAVCGKQIGPLTGEPRTFESIEAVRQAFRQQVFYWMTYLAKGAKILKENQSRWYPAPFSSSLSEGPLQKGIDITQGGAWFTNYGFFLAGLADTADSLGVIDRLIFREKKVTWDEMIKALKANWQGYDSLRQLCINGVPKYGNDNDYADEWAAFVMDTWYDSIDWINTQKELAPSWGGRYIGAMTTGSNTVAYGHLVGSLPSGHIYPSPLADTMSPVQGMDKNGPTAVIKSASKLPTHRFALGGPLNLRLSPQLVATERDIDNMMSFLRAIEAEGVYHVQFNIISSDTLRKAMKEPENYRDLMVRVASFTVYFVDLTEEQQLDIIHRTEHQGW